MLNQIDKQCTKCKKVKNIEYFYPKNKKKGYFHPYCKPCTREHVKKYATDENRAKWRARSRTLPSRYSATKRDAARRKHDFFLSMEEYATLIASNECHYCRGILPEVRGGLDRKDTHGPYSVENCVPCCVECNRIKGCALTYEEMLFVAEALHTIRSLNKTGRAA